MKTAFGIFAHDFKRLVGNPLAFAVVLGIIVVAGACAWYPVAVLWSPDRNAGDVRIAVVNEDEGAQIEGLDTVDVGSLVADAVRQDHRFAWDVVDGATGQAGLESGAYYAEFVIPPDFSRQFCSVTDGNVGQPVVEYRVNQKGNVVALEAADAGAGTLDLMVNQAFSAVVSDVSAGVTQKVLASIVGAAGSADSRAQANLSGIADKLKEASGSFKEADKLIERWRKTVQPAQDSLDALEGLLPDMKTELSKCTELLADTRTKAHTVSSEYSADLAKNGPEALSALDDIVKQVAKAAESMAGVRDKLTDAEDRARETLERNQEIIVLLESISNPSDEVKNALDELRKRADDLQDAVTALATTGQEIDSATGGAAEEALGAAEDVLEALDDLKGFDDKFNTKILPKLDTSMDSLARLLGSLDSTVGNLEVQISEAKSLLDQLDRVLKQTKGVLDQTSESLALAGESLESARTSLTALSDSEFVKKAAELSGIDVKAYAAFMASPVTTEVVAECSPVSYGAAVAPFYANVAIWLGVLVLLIVVRPEAGLRAFPGARPWQAYVGRLLLVSALALVLAAVVCAGDLVFGVQAANPVAFVGAGLACALACASVAYALVLVFEHVGTALALLLLAAQIPGASGMYPAGLLPAVFQDVHRWLPFTYGVGAMREAIGGLYGSAYLADMLWLLAFALVVLVVALFVRPGILGVVGLFDDKLKAAGVFAAGEGRLGAVKRRGLLSIRAMLSNPDTREIAIGKARSFERFYGASRVAIRILIVLVPVALLVALSLLGEAAGGRVFALTVLVAAVAVLFCAVVAIEYVHDCLRAHLVATGVVSPHGREGRDGGSGRAGSGGHAAASWQASGGHDAASGGRGERAGHVGHAAPGAHAAHGASSPAASRRNQQRSASEHQQAGRPSTWRPSSVGGGRHLRGKGGKRQ